MNEITVQRGSEIGFHPMHGATGAGRGSSARVGGEASVAGGSSHENLAGGAERPAGSFLRGAIVATHERWTEADKLALRRDWRNPSILNEQLEARFGRSLCAIRAKAQSMRLGKRPSECDGKRMAALARRATLSERCAKRRAEIAEMQAQREAEERRRWAELAQWRIAHARELLRRGIRAETVAQAWRMQPAARVVTQASADDDDTEPSKPLPPSPWRKVKAELVQRKCLRCRREFAAPGKFVRLCDYCRTRDEGVL